MTNKIIPTVYAERIQRTYPQIEPAETRYILVAPSQEGPVFRNLEGLARVLVDFSLEQTPKMFPIVVDYDNAVLKSEPKIVFGCGDIYHSNIMRRPLSCGEEYELQDYIISNLTRRAAVKKKAEGGI